MFPLDWIKRCLSPPSPRSGALCAHDGCCFESQRWELHRVRVCLCVNVWVCVPAVMSKKEGRGRARRIIWVAGFTALHCWEWQRPFICWFCDTSQPKHHWFYLFILFLCLFAFGFLSWPLRWCFPFSFNTHCCRGLLPSRCLYMLAAANMRRHKVVVIPLWMWWWQWWSSWEADQIRAGAFTGLKPPLSQPASCLPPHL